MALLMYALRQCRAPRTYTRNFHSSVLPVANPHLSSQQKFFNKHFKVSTSSLTCAKQEKPHVYFVNSLTNLNRPSNLFNTIVSPSYYIRKESFHTSPPQKAPPVLWIIIRPVMNIAAFLFGRTIKKWWQKLPQERRVKVVNRLKRYKFHIIGFLSSCALGISWFFLSHLENHPLTQRNRLILFSQKDMQNISQTVEEGVVELSRSNILAPSHPLYRRVERVMLRIMESNHADIVKSGVNKWNIYVFNDPGTKNAMVLPNGTVFIYSGIMDICSTDDELGTVLSHEIAHTLLNHQGEMMSRQHFFDGLLMLFIVLLWAVLPDAAALISQIFTTKAAELLIHLPFSRQMESEADSVGLKMSAKACFDVRVASAFWAKMAIIGDIQGEVVPDEFLSTHPAHETRQKYLDELIPDALKLRDSCQCPSLSVTDPRHLIQSWRKQFEPTTAKEDLGISITIH